MLVVKTLKLMSVSRCTVSYLITGNTTAVGIWPLSAVVCSVNSVSLIANNLTFPLHIGNVKLGCLTAGNFGIDCRLRKYAYQYQHLLNYPNTFTDLRLFQCCKVNYQQRCWASTFGITYIKMALISDTVFTSKRFKIGTISVTIFCISTETISEQTFISAFYLKWS